MHWHACSKLLKVSVYLFSYRGSWKLKYCCLCMMHQTFSQLCSFDYTTKTVKIYKAPWSIQDKPRFAYRGLLLGEAQVFKEIFFILLVVLYYDQRIMIHMIFYLFIYFCRYVKALFTNYCNQADYWIYVLC